MARQSVGFDPDDFSRLARETGDRLRRSRQDLDLGRAGYCPFAALYGAYYQVEPDEVGLVTRFGRFVRTCNPGPARQVPFGIEQVQKVPVQRQLKQEFGFRTATPTFRGSFHKDDKTRPRRSC